MSLYGHHTYLWSGLYWLLAAGWRDFYAALCLRHGSASRLDGSTSQEHLWPELQQVQEVCARVFETRLAQICKEVGVVLV